MNQDQVKEQLLKIRDDVTDFQVIFSGKESKKVDGLYHPESMEIIIHNKNFCTDNELMYTAIHEFSHHIQFTEHDVSIKRPHNKLFWSIFHGNLKKAESIGVYENVFITDNKFIDIIGTIKGEYLRKNGELMKGLGKILIAALDLCQQNHAIFEDFVDRALGMDKRMAKAAIKVYAMDVNPGIGFDNMKIVSSIKDDKVRAEAEKSFLEGSSQQSVKQFIDDGKESPIEDYNRLKSQRDRIEKNIHELELKLEEVQTKLDGMEETL